MSNLDYSRSILYFPYQFIRNAKISTNVTPKYKKKWCRINVEWLSFIFISTTIKSNTRFYPTTFQSNTSALFHKTIDISANMRHYYQTIIKINVEFYLNKYQSHISALFHRNTNISASVVPEYFAETSLN